MVDVLDCPLTVKMRAGIYKTNWNAHKLIPKLREWGVSLVTVRPIKMVEGGAGCTL
jgi:tRNA-dihydrouridine synthase 3